MRLLPLAALLLALAPGGRAEESVPPVADPERAAARLGLTIDREQPMKIGSERLEYIEPQDRVVFRGNVRVTQGDLHLSCDWLEAIYPDGARGSPRKITARGSVRITQARAEVTCEEAVLDNERCHVKCVSSAAPSVLRRGCDVIEGSEMDFDLCNGRLEVRGRSSVYLEPDCASADGEPGP